MRYPFLFLLTSTLALSPLVYGNSDPPAPFPLAPSKEPIVDSQLACDALRDKIPTILASLEKTKHSEPLIVSNVISKLYLNGDNPATKDLINDIPSNATAGAAVSLQSIIASAGDWDRDAVKADEGYGLEDEIQTEQGGLPSFCRFGASIQTSNSSSTWFETWMPVPSNGTNYTQPSALDELIELLSTQNLPPQKRLVSLSNLASASISIESSNVNQNSTPDQDSTPDQQARNSTNSTTGGASRDNWRGRLVFLGSGGQRGAPAYPEMKQVLARYREATASSNLGHFGTGASTNWTIGQPEAQIDFGYRGTHVAALASQVVVQTFYDVEAKSTSKKKQKREDEIVSKRNDKKNFYHGFPAYFKGCSTGGRQAMAAAQRSSSDFNGIIAGSPAIYYSNLNAFQIHVNSFVNDSSSSRYIPQTLYPVIHDFVLSECDNLDGLKDAVIENPARCKPRLELLLCAPNSTTTNTNSTLLGALGQLLQSMVKSDNLTMIRGSNAIGSLSKRSLFEKWNKRNNSSGSEAGQDTTISNSTSSSSSNTTYAPAGKCLTTDQLANLKDIYSPYQYPNGDIIHDSVLYGSEVNWPVLNGVIGVPFPAAPGWFQYQVLNQTGPSNHFSYYDAVNNNFTLIRLGQELDPGGTNTDNPDMSKFFHNGGKLLHYHGLADQLIPSGSSDRFYHAIHKAVGGDLSNSYRYVRIPGMGHCRGGDGAWNFGGASQTDDGSRPYQFDSEFDMLLAMFDWVEKGEKPHIQKGAGYKITNGSEPLDTVTLPNQMQQYGNGLKYIHRFCPYPQELVAHNGTHYWDECKVVSNSS